MSPRHKIFLVDYRVNEMQVFKIPFDEDMGMLKVKVAISQADLIPILRRLDLKVRVVQT